jgi:hypothetical protein
MNTRFFVYPTPDGPASENFATLVDAIVRTRSPVGGAVIVQGARGQPSGPAGSDTRMAVCKTAGTWTLTGDGEEEHGTDPLVKRGLALVEQAPPAAPMTGATA